MGYKTLAQKAAHCQMELKRQRYNKANGLCIRCGLPNDGPRKGMSECHRCGGEPRVPIPAETIELLEMIRDIKWATPTELSVQFMVPFTTVNLIMAGQKFPRKMNPGTLLKYQELNEQQEIPNHKGT